MTIRRRMDSVCRRWRVMPAVVFLAIAVFSAPFARADSPHDMLLFLSLEGLDRFDASEPELEDTDGRSTASFLYTYNSDRFRFLGEYIWSDTEAEMERFQGAWVVDDKTTLWLGRFHTISNYWTTEYHHGQFMQTSISRPGLEEWEDESGPMPSHVTGAWLEHEFDLNNQSAINFGLSAGLSPRFEGYELVAFDVLEPTSGHEMAVSTRLAYRPDILSLNQVGVTISHNDIAVVSDSSPTLADLNMIRQITYGLFSNWKWDDWRLSSNFVYFDVEMQYGTGKIDDHFFLGYIQAEYEVNDNWTMFGRTEFGDGEDASTYLQLLPSVIAHRQMLGVRWDVADSHALTLEIADTSLQGDDLSHDFFKELRVQWSAVFP